VRQAALPSVDLPDLPPPPRVRKERKQPKHVGASCIACGRAVSERSTYTQCATCRQAARNLKASLLLGVRVPKTEQLLEVAVGTISPAEAPQVLALLQRLANRLRAEAGK
jgi:hypothetical protein